MLVLSLPSTASLVWSHPEPFPECHGSRLASHLLYGIAWSFWSSSFYLLSAGITGVQYTLSLRGRQGRVPGLCIPGKHSANRAASPAQGLTYFFVISSGLRMEPRASFVLGRCYTTELGPVHPMNFWLSVTAGTFNKH